MSTSVLDDPSASYKLLAAELVKRRYVVQEVPRDNTVIVSFRSPTGKVWNIDASHIRYPGNSELVRNLSIRKSEGYAFAESHGFPVPFTMVVNNTLRDDKLQALLDEFGVLIVKPEDSSLSKGLTVNITNIEMLKGAIAAAREVSTSVLIQQQVYGQEIRFIVIDGKVMAALLRETARVIGDGASTVAELIQRENENRRALKHDVITYPQLDASIVDEALLQSVAIPAKGETIELASSTMIRGGCSIYDIRSKVHPSYVKKIEELVASLGASLIVVDVFCAAYDLPAMKENYWLIEFNTAPMLKLFYACRDGAHVDIVPHIVDVIDRHINAEP